MTERKEFEDLLRQLVQIKSPYFHEAEIAEFIEAWFCENGISAQIHSFHEDKLTDFRGKNVVGMLDSGQEGPCVYLGGHMDTVMQCDGWTKDPFEGETVNDRMYGVGTLDMKSGCAAIMLAIKSFSRQIKKEGGFRGKLIYHFVSDEEGPYGLGTLFLIKDRVHALAENADFAIIAEPAAGFTGKPHPCICLGAKGGYNYTIKLHGKAAHAATPNMGINALTDAAAVIKELEKMTLVTDDKLGSSTPCVIRVNGGGAACSVPDYAEIEVFHHTVRGETQESIRKRVSAVIGLAGIKSDAELVFRTSPIEGFDGGFEAYCIDENDSLLCELKDSVREVCGTDANIAYFQSIGDFNHIGGKLNIPTVLLGADGKNFHSSDEYVNIPSAAEVANIIEDFLLKALT